MKLAPIGHVGGFCILWDRVTDLAMLLTIVVVGVDLTYLMLAWPRFPYSSGAAALLCVGAFIGRNIDDYALRCVLAMTVSGLLVLRLCSGLFPATFPASHGLVGNFDAAVLAAQILLCGALVITAFLRTDNESPRSSSPTAGASGQTL